VCTLPQRIMSKEEFENAVNYVKEGPPIDSITNDMKLNFYAYFKQGTTGKVNEKQPSRLNLIARAKWDVWNKLGNMSKEDAMKAYIKQLEKLVPKWREWKAPKAKL
jgi:diazepam-binding inhibitor (GABA receptor modulating acyl-CoA-binding protein)